MGFGAIYKPPAADANTGAGMDAILEAARAGASGGDIYRDTTDDQTYSYNTTGAGYLVPACYKDRTLTALSNASGSAYFSLGDEDADITGRGWVFASSATGNDPTTAGTTSPLDFDPGTDSGPQYSQAQFTPSAAISSTARLLCVAKIEVVSVSNYVADLSIDAFETGNAPIRTIAPDKGATAGDWCFAQRGSALGASNISAGTAAKWIWWETVPEAEASNNSRLCVAAQCGAGIGSPWISTTGAAQVLRSSFNTHAAGPYLQIICYSKTNAGSPTTGRMKIYEFACWRVT